jgi:hypothetical protein
MLTAGGENDAGAEVPHGSACGARAAFRREKSAVRNRQNEEQKQATSCCQRVQHRFTPTLSVDTTDAANSSGPTRKEKDYTVGGCPSIVKIGKNDFF